MFKVIVERPRVGGKAVRKGKEPDAYTQLGCVMNIADQALGIKSSMQSSNYSDVKENEYGIITYELHKL
jgi:hypothetical protein